MRSALPVAVAAVVLVAAGCAGGSNAAADGKITVVASTNVWGSVAAAVGGQDVSVKSLINDPSGDPHSYQDKPEDATLLTDARLILYNGGGYDDFFTKLAKAAGTDARQVNAYDVSGHPQGENEHVWYELATVRKVADKVATELGAIDPSNKDTYAGIADVTPPEFSEAIEEETDPPVIAVADTTDLITKKRVVALVNNDQTETNVTNQLISAARTAGVPVVDVSETLPPGVTDYVEWMTKEVDSLAGAVS